MPRWVLAFGGDGARANYETTMGTGSFWVASNRTPIRRARPGDRALLYVAGKGFAAEAVVVSGARTPYGEVRWSSKKPPAYGLCVGGIHPFASPILYRFPKDGPHPVLGFHRYALTGGFTTLSEEGFDDVLGWADAGRPAARAPANPRVCATVAAEPVPPAPPGKTPRTRPREKRVAGQHASGEGRKRAALWTVAEMGASAFGLKRAESFAREKALSAERTWVAGGRAEEKVGAALDGLRGHGFYLFHDVELAGVGNVDHVALGPRGFFAVETKGHKGRVSSRGGELLLNGRVPEKNFVAQAWRGCYRLREILGAEVMPLLCFAEAYVEGRIMARGVRVLPLRWLAGEILGREARHEPREVKLAVNAMGAATGCYPSTVPGGPPGVDAGPGS